MYTPIHLAPGCCRHTSDRVTKACGSQKLSSSWFTGQSNKDRGDPGLAETLACTHASCKCRGLPGSQNGAFNVHIFSYNFSRMSSGS